MIQKRFRSPVTTLLAALLLAGIMGACTGEAGEGDSPTSPAGSTVAEVEYQSFELVNDARQDQGVEPALKYRDALSDVARAHSKSMRENGFFSHKGLNGDRLADRLRAAGIPFSAAGENIARVKSGGNPALVAHDLLMSSEDHRGNIMSPTFKRMGVGISRRGDEYWITQIFIKP